MCDKPNTGIVNRLKIESKYRYKRAYREAARCAEAEFDDDISNLYLKKDSVKFWRKWNGKFSNRNATPTTVNGLNNDQDIVNLFCEHFSKIYFDSHSDTSDFVECLHGLHDALDNDVNDTDNMKLFDIEDIKESIKCLKNGKACGRDSLTKENIVHMPTLLL